MEVPANERDLEFVFTAPTFDQPGLTRFRYRLDGYDDEWKEVRGHRSVSYTNLPAGDYTCRVRAEAGDASARSSQDEASWSFAIQPRVTEMWWFYALLAPAVLGAVYGVVAVRLRRLEQQRARLERLVAERTAQLKDANEEPFAVTGNSPLTLTGSVGFSLFPFGAAGASAARHDPRDWQSVISLADHALYTVKESGRNGWAGVVPAPELDPAMPVQDLAREVEARVTRGEVQLVTSRRRA